MTVIRTILWTIIALLLLGFGLMNWGQPAAIFFWPSFGEHQPVVLGWPVTVIAYVFFAAGALPVWLYLRAVRWRLSRRIETLERSLQASSMPSHRIPPPVEPAPVTAPAPVPFPPASPEKTTDL